MAESTPTTSSPAQFSVKRVGIAAVVAGVVALLIPQEKLDAAGETWARLTKQPPQACLDYIRQGLKDPDSARLVSGYFKVDSGQTYITYKAKNGFGAYEVAKSSCFVMDGEVNAELTELTRRSEQLREDANASTARLDCLDRQIALQKTGLSLAQARAKAGCAPAH